MDVEQKVMELGRFVRFGAPVAIDKARRLLHFLPESQAEQLVEFPNEDIPSEEELDIRVSWY